MSYNTTLVEQMVANGSAGSREVNDALYPLVAAGDTVARKRMIEGNMSLVIGKVDSYIGGNPGASYLRDDLISEGFVGLVTAVNKMAERAPSESPNATGYMSYWISHHIGSTVDKESAAGVTERTVQRTRREGEKMAHAVPMPEVIETWDDKVVDPMTLVDLQDEIIACCETDEDRIIVEMRAKYHSDKDIADRLECSVTGVWMLRRAIYSRFLEKSGMRGEV